MVRKPHAVYRNRIIKKERTYTLDEWMQERFDLAKERVREIMEEKDVA